MARYIGTFARQFSTRRRRRKQKRRNPEERHIIVKKPELRIVPQVLWDRAQKVRSARRIYVRTDWQAAASRRDPAQQ
ncbi:MULTISPECIES: recombinase family protein [Bradyrhizobium]|uniref:recombinase family protein n=1 Tax=Bradyrhizobium TaxID=374 RepID=UPI0023B0F746|nr:MULTISPECIES: recombinase family protein [Bradyrhizobium]